MVSDSLIITIALMGDIMLGNVIQKMIPPDSGFVLFSNTCQYIEDCDLSFANLEGTFESKNMIKRKKDFVFIFPENTIHGLKKSSIKGISIANNHIFDAGKKSALYTYNLLKKEGFIVSGLKGTYDTFNIKNLKMGFVAFSVYDYTNNLLDEKSSISLIEKVSKECDILIVSFHAGAEGDSVMHVRDKFEYMYSEKRGNVKRFAKKAIDSGADVVFGHGPHVIRGLEIYKGKIIAYSLGNFACFGGFNLKYPRNVSFILKLRVDKKGNFKEGEIIPFLLEPPGIPKYDKTGTAVNIIKKLIQEDNLNGIQIEGNIVKVKKSAKNIE